MVKKRILVCDDNQEVLQILTIGLHQLSEVQVIPLSLGKEVVDYLNQATSLPDLLIVDLILPDMEGDDVISLLRKDKRYEKLPIILMSGVIYNIDNRARAVGADDFLLKPFSLHDLKEKARNLLAST